jgi:hypothetical protein
MRAFLFWAAGMGAITLLACGGNVVVDGSSGGVVGSGGVIGSGGAIGVTTGEGGTLGSDCAALAGAFDAANAAATACNQGDPPSVCMGTGVSECGCPEIANATGDLIANEIAAQKALAASACLPPCPEGCVLVSAMFAQCLPTPSGYQCVEGPG